VTTAREITPFGPPAHFYEDPRWHDGRWWAVDMRGKTVFSFGADGAAKVELELADDRPSGLGWLPDGTFLVVSMEKRRLLGRAPGARSFEVYADLAPLVADVDGFLNDMTVDTAGHAYVAFDADIHKYASDAALGRLVHVNPQGRAEIAATELNLPNGIVVTRDRKTLIVAETMKPQFSAYPIAADGSLGERSVWARLHPKADKRAAGGPPLGEESPALDGCWMDAEGCIWVADSRSACLRVAPGGAVVDAIFLPGEMKSWACCLGGEDGRSLMICGADANFQDRMSRKGSQLFITEVDAPGI
jgi:sugar lactone lactonase YvrE